jgi:hypothetical protein
MLEKLLGSRSLSTIMGHFVIVRSLFLLFQGARPSLNGPTCCPRLFRMLGFDHSYISLLFLIGWSLYSFSCGGTNKDRYLSFLNHIMGYPCNVTWGHPITCLAFWKSSSVILSSNAVFLYGPITWARIYFAFSKCSFECWANMFSLLCKSNNRGLVINSS